jgi:hypothetical protein
MEGECDECEFLAVDEVRLSDFEFFQEASVPVAIETDYPRADPATSVGHQE